MTHLKDDGALTPRETLSIWCYRAQQRRRQATQRFQHWVVRTFMRDLHVGLIEMSERNDKLTTKVYRLYRERADLRQERASLTETLMTLVARDPDGHWTTVFDADARLPDEIASYLTDLVGRA